ncbi:MAG: hypothetical protein WA080_02690 [Sulfuricurvum sp.]
MNIYEAIELLRDTSIVLKNERDEIFQRQNSYSVFRTYSEATKPSPTSIGGTMYNQEFVKTHVDDNFERVPQWYEDIKLPILCKVKVTGWTGYKIVEFKYQNGSMLQTGFGESYCIGRSVEILPLSKKECLKRFYEELPDE